jgi:pimeloyl-ACP methyl ester carboxylesterase
MTNSHVLLGTGPHKVIALHGWFGSAKGWGPLQQVLDTRNFTYAFMDYRGYGGSTGRKGEYSIEEIAADTLELANFLGWERFNLIGHSMGGKAIQRVLLDAPQRVDKLVAITPVPASGVPFDEQGWNLFSSAAKDTVARKAIIDFSTGNRLSAHWLDAMVKHSIRNSTIEAFGAYLPAWAKSDFSSQIDGNQTPIKVIIGEHDPSLTAEVMEATYLRWYRNATLECIGNAGHYPMDETPVVLATSIEKFLGA